MKLLLAAVATLAALAGPASAQPPSPKPPADKAAPQGQPPPGHPPTGGTAPQGQAQPPGAHPPMGQQAPQSPADVNRTLYAVGLAIAQSLDVFSLTAPELDTVLRGLRDGHAGKPKFELDAKTQTAVNELARARAPKAIERASQKEKDAGAPYLAKVAKEKGARKTASGAIVVPEKEGTGASPKETDKVKVNYTGRLVSGRVFDTSTGRGPAEFPLNGVIKCWSEALQTMKVGGKAKVVCPSEIAYGERGQPQAGIPGHAVLTFDVELLEIVK